MASTYTTISGDMWDSIAYSQMGDVLYTNKLIEANVAYKDIYIFPHGVKLVIPDTETKINSSLPPWKRVTS